MKWNRLWIFFVIIAIGLALSWGRVGQNTREDMGSDDFLLLRSEPNCALLQGACAAYLSDMALVAKAVTLADARLGLYFKLVGVDVGGVDEFTVQLIHAPAPPQTLAVLRRVDDWQAIYSGKPLTQGQVRVSFKYGGSKYVADYSLKSTNAQ